jgi:hypothetical protein
VEMLDLNVFQERKIPTVKTVTHGDLVMWDCNWG